MNVLDVLMRKSCVRHSYAVRSLKTTKWKIDRQLDRMWILTEDGPSIQLTILIIQKATNVGNRNRKNIKYQLGIDDNQWRTFNNFLGGNQKLFLNKLTLVIIRYRFRR